MSVTTELNTSKLSEKKYESFNRNILPVGVEGHDGNDDGDEIDLPCMDDSKPVFGMKQRTFCFVFDWRKRNFEVQYLFGRDSSRSHS